MHRKYYGEKVYSANDELWLDRIIADDRPGLLQDEETSAGYFVTRLKAKFKILCAEGSGKIRRFIWDAICFAFAALCCASVCMLLWFLTIIIHG